MRERENKRSKKGKEKKVKEEDVWGTVSAQRILQ